MRKISDKYENILDQRTKLENKLALLTEKLNEKDLAEGDFNAEMKLTLAEISSMYGIMAKILPTRT